LVGLFLQSMMSFF